MLKKIGTAVVVTIALSGCQSTPLTPEEQNIVLSPKAPPRDCKFAGPITAKQGDAFVEENKSTMNLEQAALHDIRYQAANLGANYVQLMGTHPVLTGSPWSRREPNMVYTANAYRCFPIP